MLVCEYSMLDEVRMVNHIYFIVLVMLTEKETVSPLSLAPPKETHLAVPSLTTDVSSLRHVQSCPESLQRFGNFIQGPMPILINVQAVIWEAAD